MDAFKLESTHIPAGDQPAAIAALVKGLKKGERHQTLLGVTGSGKTFAAANVIASVQKPTLVIAHNKTLAAQLTQEYREFFPNNAVHYFVSYYDYYQPEAYMPVTDTYIEKEAMVNAEIDRLRHASTQALLTRNDVIIVASVSCIYGLGSPEEYKRIHKHFVAGLDFDRAQIIRDLVALQFTRTNADLTPGTFRAVGNAIEVMPVNETVVYRVSDSKIERINAVSRALLEEVQEFFLFPAKHYVTAPEERERAANDIQAELEAQLKRFEKEGKILEADRIKRRTRYDLAMIREMGYCNGIENYSRHFDGRSAGEPAYTLLSYFPKDFLTIIDESHVTVPQLGGMYAGDQSRKNTLIDHGFRLPSARDNRPLTFAEFEERVGQTIYTSATPGPYELKHSGTPIQMVIRPTGLIDPEIILRPVDDQVANFIAETQSVVEGGGRVLVTTLTKKMAEDLSEFLKGKGVKAEYIHSDIKTIERITILTRFRKGEFDCLVGVNLLREGLDLPEVELVGILDADKEGFLRSETALIQTIGRAARNVKGRVILYADKVTGSLDRAVKETNRRRTIQVAYNTKHGITPETIKKNIHDITDSIMAERAATVDMLLTFDLSNGTDPKRLKQVIADKRESMGRAVEVLDFETAALLRDEIAKLEGLLPPPSKKRIAASKKHPKRVYLDE